MKLRLRLMLAVVDLDDRLLFEAREIDDLETYERLAAELEAGELTGAEAPP